MGQTVRLEGLVVCRNGSAKDRNSRLCSCQDRKTLRTTQALATVQAFVAGPIADGDVTAIRTSRRVLLKVRNGLTEAPDDAARLSAQAVFLTIGAVARHRA